MKKLKILKCKRCGYQWVPRVSTEPKRCANCKSPYWNCKYEFGKETVKKVSDFQQKRWAAIRKENGKKSPP